MVRVFAASTIVVSAASEGSCSLIAGHYVGGDVLRLASTDTAQKCCDGCCSSSKSNAWTYIDAPGGDHGSCYCKNSHMSDFKDAGASSGYNSGLCSGFSSENTKNSTMIAANNTQPVVPAKPVSEKSAEVASEAYLGMGSCPHAEFARPSDGCLAQAERQGFNQVCGGHSNPDPTYRETCKAGSNCHYLTSGDWKCCFGSYRSSDCDVYVDGNGLEVAMNDTKPVVDSVNNAVASGASLAMGSCPHAEFARPSDGCLAQAERQGFNQVCGGHSNPDPSYRETCKAGSNCHYLTSGAWKCCFGSYRSSDCDVYVDGTGLETAANNTQFILV